MPDYTARHLEAFQRFKAAGYALQRLDETELSALCEDPHFRSSVEKERTRRQATRSVVHERPPAAGETLAMWTLDALAEQLAPLFQHFDDRHAGAIAALEERVRELEAELEALRVAV